MQLVRGLHNWTENGGCVATIGNFDGVHLGHRAMLNDVKRLATKMGLPACVISFDPLPREYFIEHNKLNASPHAPIQRLQGLRNRIESLSEAGIDVFLLLEFNERLAAQSADDFVSEVLVDRANVRHLVVGDDFRYGHKRSGTFNSLVSAGDQHGFAVTQQRTVLHDNERISSSRIRDALALGNLTLAQQLLGRPYRISGRVIHGEKVGRQLGFPTANVALKGLIPPLKGVFAVVAEVAETGEIFGGVANLGERPTIGGRALLLEVHLLDSTVDLYAKHLRVDFVNFIRGEQKFDSLDALKAQIVDDANQATELLKTNALLRNPMNRIH